MSDLTPAEADRLKRRARLGVAILLGRTGILHIGVLVGRVYLARVLGPAEFATLWIVQQVLAFFQLFGDAGLGASLVQKKDHPTQTELCTVFWTHVALGLFFVAAAWALAPLLHLFWPDLPPSAPLLMRVLSFELLIIVVRVIPAILMERELQFARLAILDLLGMVLFYAISSALVRWVGIYALVIGILGSGFLGTFVNFAMRPWLPSLLFDRRALRSSLRFGLAYQTKNLVGALNGGIIPIYGGARLGAWAFGLVSWAQGIAYYPLELVSILSRVNFPLYSRLQNDRRAVSELLVRSLVVGAVTTYAFIGLFVGLGPRLVEIIFGPKWVAAVPMLYVFSLALIIGFMAPLAASAFDALGRPDVAMRLGIFWTALNWAAVLIAMRYFDGPLAFTLAYTVHIVVGNIAVLIVLRQLISARVLLRRLAAPLLGCGASAPLGMRLLQPWATGPWTLAAAILASFVVFASVTLLLDRDLLREIRSAFRPAPAEGAQPITSTAPPRAG